MSDDVDTDKFAFPRGPHSWKGMTLRDYFAAKAMQSIIGNSDQSGLFDDGPSHISSISYSIADAMLAERAK